jgi:hypothetical protein
MNNESSSISNIEKVSITNTEELIKLLKSHKDSKLTIMEESNFIAEIDETNKIINFEVGVSSLE